VAPSYRLVLAITILFGSHSTRPELKHFGPRASIASLPTEKQNTHPTCKILPLLAYVLASLREHPEANTQIPADLIDVLFVCQQTLPAKVCTPGFFPGFLRRKQHHRALTASGVFAAFPSQGLRIEMQNLQVDSTINIIIVAERTSPFL
jgi:hypothetical protein